MLDFSTMPEGHFKQQNHRKRHKKSKTTALNRLWKEQLVYSRRAETRRQGLTLLDLSWKDVCWASPIFVTLYRSANDHKSAMSSGLEATNKMLVSHYVPK